MGKKVTFLWKYWQYTKQVRIQNNSEIKKSKFKEKVRPPSLFPYLCGCVCVCGLIWPGSSWKETGPYATRRLPVTSHRDPAVVCHYLQGGRETSRRKREREKWNGMVGRKMEEQGGGGGEMPRQRERTAEVEDCGFLQVTWWKWACVYQRDQNQKIWCRGKALAVVSFKRRRFNATREKLS